MYPRADERTDAQDPSKVNQACQRGALVPVHEVPYRRANTCERRLKPV